MAGAGFSVGSKQNLSGRWAGEEKQQAEKSLTLAPAPGTAIKPKKDSPLEPDRDNPLDLQYSHLTFNLSQFLNDMTLDFCWVYHTTYHQFLTSCYFKDKMR